MISVYHDTAKTVPGKSTAKGVTVLVQGASVMVLLQLALSYFEADPETAKQWLAFGAPILTAAWHVLQKFILHKFGVKVEFKPPAAKILPLLLVGILLGGCATMMTEQVDSDGAKFRTEARAIGEANIDKLDAKYHQEVGPDGTMITTIGQQSDSLISNNEQLIGGVVSAAVEGAIRAFVAAGLPIPVNAAPPPRIAVIPKPEK